MSVTDELRRLLDERGVEYKRHYLNTLWYAGTKLYMATDNMDGTLTVDNLTPEQAVAATLGSELNARAERTCHMEPSFTKPSTIDFVQEWLCSECNEYSLTQALDGDDELPNYCPECGAKVVENERVYLPLERRTAYE